MRKPMKKHVQYLVLTLLLAVILLPRQAQAAGSPPTICGFGWAISAWTPTNM